MGKKKRNDRTRSAAPPPWWKRTTTKIALIPLGTLVALWGAVFAYKTTGATEVRTQVYQPLFSDLVAVEQSVDTLSPEHPPIMKAFPELKRTGGFELASRDLREDVLRISEQSSKLHGAVLAVRELAVREMSSRIVNIRTEESDREWQEKTVRTLREMSKSQKGIFDSFTFTMRHEGRSRAVDLRNPGRPEIAAPGGPTFTVRDWVSYPGSLKLIEELWTDRDFLFFNDQQDAWYYRTNRNDLARQKMTLPDFLAPAHKVLMQSRDFRALLDARPVLQMDIARAKAKLADRIRDPKQLRDLLYR